MGSAKGTRWLTSPELHTLAPSAALDVDTQTVSEERVEIVLPDDYRLPREANRALVHVIMAVRDRMFGSERGMA